MYRRLGKRLLDIACASLAIVALSPFMALASFLIWLEDRGSPMFRQMRVGQNGQPFVILKFRTMSVSTENVASDRLTAPTITRVGRVLRRLNVDELPQLINILRADMSIVGPRPALPSQTELIALRADLHADSIRPGLTGLAQVRAYDNMPDQEKAAHDAEYVRNVRFTTDVKIIAQTVRYLTKPPPTY